MNKTRFSFSHLRKKQLTGWMYPFELVGKGWMLSRCTIKLEGRPWHVDIMQSTQSVMESSNAASFPIRSRIRRGLNNGPKQRHISVKANSTPANAQTAFRKLYIQYNSQMGNWTCLALSHAFLNVIHTENERESFPSEDLRHCSEKLFSLQWVHTILKWLSDI